MLTKKRVAKITILMTAVYFILLMLLPDSVVGTRRADSLIMFSTKIMFLAISAAITTALILLLIFRRDFINTQRAGFNRYKYLLGLLVKRDFVTKYRKSTLGFLWSMLNPLLMMLVMTLVFSYVFNKQIENYPIYFFSGFLFFNFFTDSTNQAMGSVIGSEKIIRKVYVPKYIFPLSKVVSSLVNMLCSFVAFLIVFIVTGVKFKPTMLLLPIPVVYTFVFSLGVAMMISSLTVFFRDIKHLYGVLTRLLFYMTPLIYPIQIIPQKLVVFWGFNPLYHFVDYSRDIVLYGTVPDLWANIVCIGFSAAALCVGLYIFMSKQDRFILYF